MKEFLIQQLKIVNNIIVKYKIAKIAVIVLQINVNYASITIIIITQIFQMEGIS